MVYLVSFKIIFMFWINFDLSQILAVPLRERRAVCNPYGPAGYKCRKMQNSGSSYRKQNAYIDPNRVKSNSFGPKPTQWSAPEPTAPPVQATVATRATSYGNYGSSGIDSNLGNFGIGYNNVASIGNYRNGLSYQNSQSSTYQNAIGTMYGNRNRYQQYPSQRAVQANTVPRQFVGANSVRTQQYPYQAQNQMLRQPIQTASPVNSQYNQLLAAFGEQTTKPTTTTKAATTTKPTQTTQPIITLPRFNFGTTRSTTTTTTTTTTTQKIIEPNVNLKSASSSGMPSGKMENSSGNQYITAQQMQQMMQMMMGSGYGAQFGYPSQPSIPSATYSSSSSNTVQSTNYHNPKPDPVNGLTGAALEASKGRYSTHGGHLQSSDPWRASSSMPSGRMQNTASSSLGSRYSSRNPIPKRPVAKKPYGQFRSGHKAGVFRRPTPKPTTPAPTTSTYAPWDCGRDTAGILWCAGNRIFEKKEKKKPEPKNTYGKTQLSKFSRNIKAPQPTPKPKWVAPAPSLGIRNRGVFYSKHYS